MQRWALTVGLADGEQMADALSARAAQHRQAVVNQQCALRVVRMVLLQRMPKAGIFLGKAQRVGADSMVEV